MNYNQFAQDILVLIKSLQPPHILLVTGMYGAKNTFLCDTASSEMGCGWWDTHCAETDAHHSQYKIQLKDMQAKVTHRFAPQILVAQTQSIEFIQTAFETLGDRVSVVRVDVDNNATQETGEAQYKLSHFTSFDPEVRG